MRPLRLALDEREDRFADLVAIEHMTPNAAAIIVYGPQNRQQGSKLMKRKRVVREIEARRAALTQRKIEIAAQKQALTVDWLDEKLVERISGAVADSDAIKGIEVGYKRHKVFGPGAEQELKAGAIKHTDGRIEVYQSKWMRDGDSSNRPTGNPVVPED